MNATRMRCWHAQLSEGRVLAGQFKVAEAAAIQDRADGTLQFLRVRARKLDVAGDGERPGLGSRRKAEHLDGGHVVRRSQETSQGLGEHQLELSAQLLEGLALLAHQVGVEGLVQDEHRAPKHGRRADGGQLSMRCLGGPAIEYGWTAAVTIGAGVSRATVRRRRNVLLVFVVPIAIARARVLEVVVQLPREAPRGVLRRSRRLDDRRRALARRIGGRRCFGLVSTASEKPGPAHSTQDGTCKARQTGVRYDGAPPEGRLVVNMVTDIVKGNVRVHLLPGCQACDGGEET